MSLRSQQAARDAADFDNHRKEGRYDHYDFAAAPTSDWGTRPGDAEKQVALDAAMVTIDLAFGKGAAARREAARLATVEKAAMFMQAAA